MIAMKFFLAIIAYLFIGLVLSWGLLLLMKGNPWLLVCGFGVYALTFTKVGCLHKS